LGGESPKKPYGSTGSDGKGGFGSPVVGVFGIVNPEWMNTKKNPKEFSNMVPASREFLNVRERGGRSFLQKNFYKKEYC
jgi:hypothetical protein